MTGQETYDFVEQIIDESMDETLFTTLLNTVKDSVEEDRDWEILKAFDSSQSASPGDTYLTAKTLPSDFRRPMDILYVGVDALYKPIPFESKYVYRNRNGFFYIDYANDQFFIIGSPGSAQTINMPYIKTTDELTLLTSWTFPERFHKLLGFMIAGYYTAGVDADNIYFRMSPEHKMTAQLIRKNLEEWNSRLTLNAMDNSASPFVENNQIGLLNIGDL